MTRSYLQGGGHREALMSPLISGRKLHDKKYSLRAIGSPGAAVNQKRPSDTCAMLLSQWWSTFHLGNIKPVRLHRQYLDPVASSI
jgi:hypothetical protein